MNPGVNHGIVGFDFFKLPFHHSPFGLTPADGGQKSKTRSNSSI